MRWELVYDPIAGQGRPAVVAGIEARITTDEDNLANALTELDQRISALKQRATALEAAP